MEKTKELQRDFANWLLNDGIQQNEQVYVDDTGIHLYLGLVKNSKHKNLNICTRCLKFSKSTLAFHLPSKILCNLLAILQLIRQNETRWQIKATMLLLIRQRFIPFDTAGSIMNDKDDPETVMLQSGVT